MRYLLVLLLCLLVGRVVPVQAASVEVGHIAVWASDVLPSGWLLADGSLLLVSAYPELAVVLGNRYGGDGVIDFAVPDLADRFVLGSGTRWLNISGGFEDHLLTLAEIPSHSHSQNVNLGVSGAVVGTQGFLSDGTMAPANQTGLLGGGQAHNNMPPYLVQHFIIAALPEAAPITSAQANQIIEYLARIVTATELISNSLSFQTTSMVTSTGYSSFSEPVTHRREQTTGDRTIALLLFLLIIIYVLKLVFNAVRGVSL